MSVNNLNANLNLIKIHVEILERARGLWLSANFLYFSFYNFPRGVIYFFLNSVAQFIITWKGRQETTSFNIGSCLNT